MTLSAQAQKVYRQIIATDTKLGDLRILAKEIKTNSELAKELWSVGELFPRLLAILIMDQKEFTPEVIQQLFDEIQNHEFEERIQLADWLMANQLTKNKKTSSMLASWENDVLAIKRRLFWYFQGRLRWLGQVPPNNTLNLLSSIEEKLLKEVPEVQWAMNFTAAWIGIYDKNLRKRCAEIGEKSGLYKDEIVARNCSPNYLPKLIEQEVKKRNL